MTFGIVLAVMVAQALFPFQLSPVFKDMGSAETW
jgi:hypothetical protein